jgi:lipopolysaccharide transport system permease protein
MNDTVEFVIDSSKSKAFSLKELWQYRELFYFFTWRDVKVKYKQTALGLLWVVLQPALTVMIFSIFFGKALSIQSSIDYPVFVFSGLLFWNAFSASVVNAGNSMISNSQIIKKIYFPRLIIPLSSILVALLDMVVAAILFLALVILRDVDVNVSQAMLYWPFALLVMLTGTVGLSCALAALTVKYRDFRYIVPFGLQIMLFLSPVIYPISIIYYPGLQYVLALNPMYGAIELFRYPLMQTIDTTLVLVSLMSSVMLFVLGIFYFKRTENYFADLA